MEDSHWIDNITLKARRGVIMQFLSNVVAKCTHSFAKSLSLAPLLSNHSFHLRFSGPTHAPPCFIKPSHPSQKHPHKRTTLSFVCPKVRTTSYSHQVICIKVLFSITDSSWLCQEEKKKRTQKEWSVVPNNLNPPRAPWSMLRVFESIIIMHAMCHR